ncbi:S8 family serine peptidase [Flavihumibacter petaseus]|uniref:Peptidase S8 family protein n=1 Tax=Flavihumibacter petaseus NBRC 106054 TaxID=1220578 RepID=A0A0E9N0T0_9BACT|nr:S8 family serine peptidase [Flavihumibacter petaseus]GAO43439.1 peptidase S8 family protein [Flavihumibacter petaseus NBRC 106054]
MSRSYVTIPAITLRDDERKPRYTGRKLVLINRASNSSQVISHARKHSLRLAAVSDFSKAKTGDYLNEAFRQADGIYFDRLKVAVINESAEPLLKPALSSGKQKQPHFLFTEQERYVYAIASRRRASADYTDNAAASWGIHAMNILGSPLKGKNIPVAVLDTGADTTHPDLHPRIRRKKTFVSGQQVTDLNGHGSHCAGLAAGNQHATRGFRYGVAPLASLLIGKVLNNQGEGTDANILAGIEWALDNKCRVVSLSLGSETYEGETWSRIYESVAAECLKQNCLIIAAAGNESARAEKLISPVAHPANCPSIMAVGALTANLGIAEFSCGGINPDGGQIDIAAPGVNIWSAWKNKGYRRESGTSAATPMVAGLAALLLEAEPTLTAPALWMKLVQTAKRLNLPATDVGAGLAFIRS